MMEKLLIQMNEIINSRLAVLPGKEHILVYQRVVSVFGIKKRSVTNKKPAGEQNLTAPYEPGRDPRSIGAVIDNFVRDIEWSLNLAQADVLVSWNIIVGEDTASHSYPVAVNDDLLVVRCDSTSWAHNLRIMRNSYLSTITKLHPDAGIQKIRFIGPDTPSWKHGSRTVIGRGVRDTYG